MMLGTTNIKVCVLVCTNAYGMAVSVSANKQPHHALCNGKNNREIIFVYLFCIYLFIYLFTYSFPKNIVSSAKYCRTSEIRKQ